MELLIWVCENQCSRDRQTDQQSPGAAANQSSHWQGSLNDGENHDQGTHWPLTTTGPAEECPSPSHSSPETVEAQAVGKLPSLVLLPGHDGRHKLGVLHQDGQFAVPLPQQASVVDVGRTCRQRKGLQ